MNPAIIGGLVGAVLLASTAAYALYERGERIDAEAHVVTYKLASEKNLKAFKDMAKLAADNAELSRANAERISQIEQFHNERDTDVARAIEAVCPDAPMDALLRRLCIQRGGSDC